MIAMFQDISLTMKIKSLFYFHSILCISLWHIKFITFKSADLLVMRINGSIIIFISLIFNEDYHTLF